MVYYEEKNSPHTYILKNMKLSFYLSSPFPQLGLWKPVMNIIEKVLQRSNNLLSFNSTWPAQKMKPPTILPCCGMCSPAVAYQC